MRVSCGLGGHVRDRHRCHEGEYALVSSRFTKTAHPACPPGLCPAYPSSSGLHRVHGPPQIFHPAAESHACPGNGGPRELPPTGACLWVRHPRPPKTSRRLGRIVKEAASVVVRKAALAQPRETLGRPRTGSGGEGAPHFSPRGGWGPRELTARLRARHVPPGDCGLLRLNSRVGGGQTAQPWVSPHRLTFPPRRRQSGTTACPHWGPACVRRPTQSSVWPCSSALRHSLPRKKVL